MSKYSLLVLIYLFYFIIRFQTPRDYFEDYFQLNAGRVQISSRDGSRAAATSKMERFVITVNGWKPIITKRSIFDVAAALDPPLS